MTEEVFTDLVDLYLDQEISEEDLKRLRAELSADLERKQLFLERRCLHRATRLALAPEADQSLPPQRHPRRKRPRSSAESIRQRRSSESRVDCSAEEDITRPISEPLPRWLLGTGMAASLLIASVLLMPVFRDSLGGSWASGFLRFQAPERLNEDDFQVEVRPSDLERYRNIQTRANQQQASLVAQMRLLGLRPELTPADKQLRSVEASSFKPGQNEISRAEHLARLQKMKPIPEPKLFRDEAFQSDRQSNWGRGGFDVHLVGY